ncbi:hypothetical protein A3I40_03305 [Candidatus Uhrbacteria bacterium RIFCSPLOWO2_02_FULL_48_12]|uniref:Polymerase beta nucleotidyltransferase domain-containing protein n=1 Tax=Candidatus Uhrbacteria bacterium RIFCSPLOWO2_02_FULL_48_12 TaxID=1802407 RepID=A0A1F7V893_9BACT|nr:MAG: hypothetical protein A3I40_03305 [Candidatus Uhrbacteria bacterium RIFCSPLOWO2_02_FULL_48_12]
MVENLTLAELKISVLAAGIFLLERSCRELALWNLVKKGMLKAVMLQIDLQVDKMKPIIRELAQKYHLLLVVLFGSQARGKTHAQSDVDIAFLSASPMGLSDIAAMQFEFTQKLHLKNIELVDLRGASPLLLREVARQSVLLYEQEPLEFANFKIYAFKRFMEAKHLLNLRAASLEKFIQKHD